MSERKMCEIVESLLEVTVSLEQAAQSEKFPRQAFYRRAARLVVEAVETIREGVAY